MPAGSAPPPGAPAGPRLTDAQRTALENVALLAEECTHPRFGKRTPVGTVVLTVNAGYE